MKSSSNKPVGQTASVGFQIGVRRTLPISQEEAWTILTSAEGLKWWIGELPSFRPVVGHKFNSKEGTHGELRVVKPMQQLRMTWQKKEWEQPSTLQIRFLAGDTDKTTISFHHEKLDNQYTREQMKRKWQEVLAKMLEATSPD